MIRVYLGVFLLIVFSITNSVVAMTSANYQVNWDSVNSGGTDFSASANYQMNDTFGEQGTGYGSSANYQIHGGYRQNDEITLYFDIVEADNIQVSTSTCDMGTLTPFATSTCQYRLVFQTNNPTGFVSAARAAGEFTNGSHDFATTTDGLVSGDAEEYGLNVATSTDGSYNGGLWNVSNNVSSTFNGIDFALTTASSTNIITNYEPFDSKKGGATFATSATNLIEHRAVPALGTEAGSYSHTVWWEVIVLP